MESSAPSVVTEEAGSAAASLGEALHGEPGGECLVCYDDLTVENYCEYQNEHDPAWHPCLFCFPCVEQLRKLQFKRYCDGVANSTCAREQRALLCRGPPVNLRDPKGFPHCGGEEVRLLWTANDGKERSAKLEGSLEGEERKRLWDELKAFMIDTEVAEDDDTLERGASAS